MNDPTTDVPSREAVDYASSHSRDLPTHPAAATSVFVGMFASVWAALAGAAFVLSGGQLGGESPLTVILAVGFLLSSLVGFTLALAFAAGAMRLWGLILNAVPLLTALAIFAAASLR